MTTLRSITRTLLAGAFALGVSASATASAQVRAPAITYAQAEQIVRRHVPNAVIEDIELDDEGGVLVYEVELRTAEGVEHEVLIDANDGHIIATRIDD